MAGLRENLDLDITQALARVDQLEARLKKATGGPGGLPVAAPAAAAAPVPGAAGGGALGGLASAFAAERVFRSLTTAIGSAVSAASDLNEQIAASEVVFGSSAPKIQAFADGAADIGLAEDEALAAANAFGSLFTALGIAQQKAAELGPTLIQRAADLASFRNVSGGTAEVIQRLSSGIVGETEPLRRLGIVINETTVKTKAMELGFADANGEVSEAGKVQARIALILEQSSIAAGDFARTSDGLANTQRRLAAEFRNVQIEVGQRLLPVVLEGVQGLSGMLGVFTSLPGPVQTLVVALAGIATAAVGIGLAALAVQRLSGALLSAGAAGAVAATAMRALAFAGTAALVIGGVVLALKQLSQLAPEVTIHIQELARATDSELVESFITLSALIGEGDAIDAIVSRSLGTAERLRDALKAQGEDTSELDAAIRAESAAQQQANEDAGAGVDVLGDLGAATETVTTQMTALDAALAATADQLDATFGRFIAAEESALALQDSVFKLGEAYGQGVEKGEALETFNRRLAESTLDVVGKIESYVESLARTGEIGADAASQQSEIRRQLLLLGDQFPELQGQIATYIDLLTDIPDEVTTTAKWDDRAARQGIAGFIEAVEGAAGFIAGIVAGTADPKSGEHLQNVVPPDVLIEPAADAGKEAGAAAANALLDEIPQSLRRSAASGLDIGGFILSGIILGPALDEVLKTNMKLAATSGLIQEVIEAAKFDPGEQLAILQAVADVDQAVLDLNEAITTYGSDSLEAAIATQTLADKREILNQTILDGIDATEKINELLKEEKDRIDAIVNSINNQTSALSALRRLEDAKAAAGKEQGRLGQFDQRIAETEAELERVRAAGGAGSLEEARLLATLNDLEKRRVEQVEKTNDANLELVEATLALGSAGADLIAQAPGWVDAFVSIALAAGLSMASIWTLVAAMQEAGRVATGTFGTISGALGGTVPVGTIAPAGTLAAAGVSTSGGGTGVGGGGVDQRGQHL